MQRVEWLSSRRKTRMLAHRHTHSLQESTAASSLITLFSATATEDFYNRQDKELGLN